MSRRNIPHPRDVCPKKTDESVLTVQDLFMVCDDFIKNLNKQLSA